MIPVSRLFEAQLRKHANAQRLTVSACIELLVKADPRPTPILDSTSEMILQTLLFDQEKNSSDFSYIQLNFDTERQILVWSLAEHISEETYLRRRLNRSLKARPSEFAR